mgnify:CR=1 FL=1
MRLDVHAHGCLDHFRACLDCHVGILDFLVILVSHLSQVRVDVIEALLVLLEDKVVVVLIHLRDLSLLLKCLVSWVNWSSWLVRGGEGVEVKWAGNNVFFHLFWLKWFCIKIEKVLSQTSN